MKHVRRTDASTTPERPYGWMDDANCRDLPGFLNLPHARQKAICATCPVRETCADFSPVADDMSLAGKGLPIYGGLTGEQQVERLREPDPCNRGHDRNVEGFDRTGWCRACRRELNARYRAQKKAER